MITAAQAPHPTAICKYKNSITLVVINKGLDFKQIFYFTTRSAVSAPISSWNNLDFCNISNAFIPQKWTSIQCSR